jgi:SAM-dependent methyltransferase
MTSQQLSTAAAIRYWDDRHHSEGDLRSGGHVGLDPFANEAFYLIRAAMLIRVIGDRASLSERLLALDAGCGKGYFSTALAKCGIQVDGIDTSPEAIAFCREHRPGRYVISSLSAWRSPFLYDVVYCVDVLFHILDDREWEASLRNLASLVRLGGRLVVADEWRDDRHPAGNYIVHRAHDGYRSILAEAGFTFREFQPYAFRENEVGFLIFDRTD